MKLHITPFFNVYVGINAYIGVNNYIFGLLPGPALGSTVTAVLFSFVAMILLCVISGGGCCGSACCCAPPPMAPQYNNNVPHIVIAQQMPAVQTSIYSATGQPNPLWVPAQQQYPQQQQQQQQLYPQQQQMNPY